MLQEQDIRDIQAETGCEYCTFFSSIEIVLDNFISLFSIPKLRTDTDTHDCTLSETSVFILQSFIILPFGTVMVVYGLSQ